jgi:hypothetical protein
MTDRFISRLAQRYEHDEVAQFLLVVDQLEDCVQLLKKDEISKTRSAVILLDNLADILLGRRVRSCFAAGERPGPGDHRAFTYKERKQLEKSFPAKLELAAGSGDLGAGVQPIITADDRAILGLSHSHRNAAYHRDEHNPEVILVIAALQLTAVTRLCGPTP